MLFAFLFNPFILGWFFLPSFALALAISIPRYSSRDISVNKKALKTAGIAASIVFVEYALYTIYQISISTRSTAILSVIEIPFSGIPLALLTFFIGWLAALPIFDKLAKKNGLVGISRLWKSFVFSILILFFIFGSIQSYRVSRARQARDSENPSEISILYTSPFAKSDRMLLEAIANNHKTPISILNELAHNNLGYTRYSVSRNPTTPQETLRFLYESQSKEMYDRDNLSTGLVVNPNLPLDLLIELSKSEDEMVRANATFNPNLPVEILCALGKEPNGIVLWQAEKNIRERNVSCL